MTRSMLIGLIALAACDYRPRPNGEPGQQQPPSATSGAVKPVALRGDGEAGACKVTLAVDGMT